LDNFLNPYISNTQAETGEMLKIIGVKSIDDLFIDIKPHQRPRSFDLPEGKSESEVVESLRKVAHKNTHGLINFVGAGYYDHYVPAAVPALISRGEFYTAYTPYQPECAQGTLQSLFEFQSSICALTEMDIANASLYDGGTALFEALTMACRLTKRNRVVMDSGVNPIYRKMIHTYTRNLHLEFAESQVKHGQSDRDAIIDLVDDKTAAVILQNPNFFGAIDDHSDIIEQVHKKGALVIESVYPIALGLLKTPGEMGADIVTGEGQSLGLSLNFGGPYLGFLATRKEYLRQMPGRIVGETVDSQGKRCFVNTLQAREQHIRREKATSNICTNVALCAIQSAIYMSLLGKNGLKELAQLNLDKTEFMKNELAKIEGVKVKKSSPTFNEFTVELPCPADPIIAKMVERGIAAGFPLGKYYRGMENFIIVAVTEKRTKEEILKYKQVLEETIKA
jgi:glycine dehydrogenase subunit 1